jgi:hypothetical protein
LRPEQYFQKPVSTVVEDEPAPTENIHARGFQTVRVYRVYEAHVSDPSLAHAMLRNSQSLSHQDLSELAWEDAQNGGKGRASAILALPLRRITDFYLAMPPKERNASIFFEQNRLDETVAAVLESIPVSKYRRL